MSQTMVFSDVVDAVDELSLEEQHALADILKRRLAMAGRQRVIADVVESEREFKAGLCRIATVNGIMREVAACLPSRGEHPSRR